MGKIERTLYLVKQILSYAKSMNSTHKFYIERTCESAIIELEKNEEATNQWIDVCDGLPEYGKEVLIFNGYIPQIAFFDKNKAYTDSKQEIFGATYWMNIPQTPKL